MIGEALEQFQGHNDGNYPPQYLLTENAINRALEINIIEQNVDYSCALGPPFECTAVSDAGWEIDYDTSAAFDDRVHCEVVGCPSCPAAGCSYNGIF